MHAIAKGFVLSCLRVDENERFCSGKTDVFGTNIIRSHQWFQDIDWDDVEAKTFVPEWQPKETLTGKMDLRCSIYHWHFSKRDYSFTNIAYVRYSSDVEDAPFADEYVPTGAAVAGSKKDAFVDF